MPLFRKPATRIVFLVLLLTTITGCGAALNPYHENFNCQAKSDDGRCVDTPTAYKEATSITELATGGSQPLKTLPSENDFQAIRMQKLAELLREPKAPLLEPPRVLRVLLLPYKGDGEELFMARYAYLKIDEAQWILTGGLEEKGE